MYQPAAGDRIIVRRTPAKNGGSMIGTVLEIVTIEGVEHIHFQSDDYGRAYLGTNEQLAAIGYTQTIERLPS
ncbi:hypothetical protein [Streptomyces sp. RKAG293]|uniref:hypothetical protein n=1 Tax=Streptomyces sp. RKAG293 TaxID=2893403 RepID=UPI0020335F58|nr:hypothetical protein [Streptomyces sp. RKAG293]MCM2424148.1 hypothetical protein [Streptomyces sp. RKAG293]